MRRDELNERLRLYALSISAETPTDRAVCDWVDERLIPPATRKSLGRGRGFDWIDAPESFKIGMEIIRLKKRGVTRNSALRIQLFLSGLNSDCMKFRSSVYSESSRANKKLFRGKTRPKDYENFDPENSKTKSIERKRLGPLAHEFADANFQLNDREILPLASQASNYHESPNKSRDIVFKAIMSLFGFRGQLGDFPTFDGLLAEPDDKYDTPAITIIRNATDAELIAARDLFIACKFAFLNFRKLVGFIGIFVGKKQEKAFQTGSLALESTEFAVTLFPLFIEGAKWLQRSDPKKRSIQDQIQIFMQAMNGPSGAVTGGRRPAN